MRIVAVIHCPRGCGLTLPTYIMDSDKSIIRNRKLSFVFADIPSSKLRNFLCNVGMVLS